MFGAKRVVSARQSVRFALKCPSCGKATISPWRKLIIGGVITAECPSCHCEITVPPYDFAILLLIVMTYQFFKPPLLYIAIAFLAYMVIRQIYIPLAAKQQAPKKEEDKGI